MNVVFSMMEFWHFEGADHILDPMSLGRPLKQIFAHSQEHQFQFYGTDPMREKHTQGVV